MSLDLRFKLMRMVALILGFYALIWATAPFTSMNISARFLLDLLDWPLDSINVPLERNTKWLSAIGAGLLAMVAILLWGIVAPALKKGDRAVAQTTLLAILVWYIIDGVGSIAVGIVSNVVFNTLYLIAMVIPLIGMPKKGLESRDKEG